MKRLLKFVTVFFVVVTFMMPLLECFDRWDRPGLGNDTEFPLFLITLFISLVLLAAVAMARRLLDRQSEVELIPIRYEMLWAIRSSSMRAVRAPFLIPPLRI